MSAPTPMNGTNVLVLTETTPGSGSFIVVGSQTGVSFDEKTSAIDMSNKDARGFVGVPGRYKATLKLDSLFVPTISGYTSLKTAMRTGVTVKVKRQEGGNPIETADAIVTDLSENFPDQGSSKCSASFEVTGGWA